MTDRNQLNLSKDDADALWAKERVAISEYKTLIETRLERSISWFETYWRWNEDGRKSWIDAAN